MPHFIVLIKVISHTHDSINFVFKLVDAQALEQKIKECGDLFKDKKEKKGKSSPQNSPIKEEEYDLLGTDNHGNQTNGSQSSTPPSSPTVTPTATPSHKTAESTQRTSKRQRIAKGTLFARLQTVDIFHRFWRC